MNGELLAIMVCPVAGGPMQEVQEVEAIAGAGLVGDRYATGEGSFSEGKVGKRQVTLINAVFFRGSGYAYDESRRNLVVEGVELMWLIGREFQIGSVRMKGIKYCDPCERPKKLADKGQSFKEAFFDRGGLVAEIIEGGIIRVHDPVIPPPKGY